MRPLFSLPSLVPPLRLLAAIVLMAMVTGSTVALFLWSLDRATEARFEHPWLLALMPVAGFAMVWAYQRFGKSVEAGNNLIVDQIHEPAGGVPLRMAPFILVSTVLTHLVGGSAGREGTAVQLGGSLASGFARVFRLPAPHVPILLMAGIAAGFGAVFGTPIAGAIFALEVLTIGRLHHHALVPVLVAALVGDWSCRAWGILHTAYRITFVAEHTGPGFHPDVLLAAKVALAGVLFGLAAHAFSEGSHRVSALYKRLIPYAPLRPVAASVLILGLAYLLGTTEYLGLGIWSPNPADATIPGFFRADHADYASWFWKAVFTILTLGAGFKGGEVTPLFFIGAGLGSALAGVLGAPPDLFAAIGFVAIFAGATNTPLACMVMAVELFGATHVVYFALACSLAYLCSGHTGIYLSQRLGVPKGRLPEGILPGTTIRQLRERRASKP